MVSGNLFHYRKNSWPPEEYIHRTTLQLFDIEGAAPPEQALRRKLNSHASILKEFSVTFKEAIQMVRLGIRLWHYVREEASHGRKAPIDPFTRERCKPSASQGVPLGGMGSGSISRGFRGEFRHFQILPGTCETSPVMANQFSIFISRDGGNKKYASVLAPGQHKDLGKPSDQGISSWGWNLNGQHSTYHALFPRAWTIYDGEPDPELKISCRQISPFIPHNYRESSLPTAVFVYTLVNTGKERAKVSLLFTWANSIGGTSHLTGDHVNEPFIGEDGVSGVLLHHKTAKHNPPVTYAIAACETQNVSVSVLPCFGLNEGSCVTAKDMWGKMEQDGHFDRENFSNGPSMPSSPGETYCAAVSASAWVEPHGKCTVAFSVAWSSPKVKFCKGKSYHRRYTKYYGTSKNAAKDLVHDSLTKYMLWEEEIEKWQNPILKDEKVPEWYKFTLFNELYFLVAGGTVWIDSGLPVEESDGIKSVIMRNKKSKKNEARIVQKPAGLVKETAVKDFDTSVDVDLTRGREMAPRESSDEEESSSCGSGGGQNSVTTSPSKLTKPMDDDDNDVGRFLYLEGVEYIMWCTYDVHFYASFALLELFPKIELSIQREFANAVLFEDRRKVKFLAEGNYGIRKVKGAVPHDLGTHDPWHEMNAYNIHDTSRWKDLNPKFVLQVYRDFAATRDFSFGADVWPAVCAAIDYMDQFDRDNDGMIENDGFPDQTYDAWTVHGISAYCGSLWLAALQAAAAMAIQLGDQVFAEKCKSKFIKAKAVFEEKLWNGSYFNYDSGSSSNSKSIQADQLAGQWYTAASGLPDLFDECKIRSALQKIHDFNVMKVQGGRIGAVNGMHPSGKVDESCMQSREVWTGVTYAAAATMIHAGMKEQAFTTAEGIFLAGWSEEGYGYAFQTPEGWTTDGKFRSLIYMRPLSIWAMQWALSTSKTVMEAPVIMAMDRAHVPSETASSSCNEACVKKISNKPRCFGNAVFHCSWVDNMLLSDIVVDGRDLSMWMVKISSFTFHLIWRTLKGLLKTDVDLARLVQEQDESVVYFTEKSIQQTPIVISSNDNNDNPIGDDSLDDLSYDDDDESYEREHGGPHNFSSEDVAPDVEAPNVEFPPLEHWSIPVAHIDDALAVVQDDPFLIDIDALAIGKTFLEKKDLNETCPFKLVAAVKDGLWMVIKLEDNHACRLDLTRNAPQKLCSKVITNFFKNRIQDEGSILKLRAMITELLREYGIEENRKSKEKLKLETRGDHAVWAYCRKDWAENLEAGPERVFWAYARDLLKPMAWTGDSEFPLPQRYVVALRARNLATEMVYGSHDQSFAVLLAYLEMLKMCNPDTVYYLEIDIDDRFMFMFVALGVCIVAFKLCMRPVIAIDGTHLKGKTKGILFITITKDGNEQCFPLTIGVGPTKNDVAWTWFLERFKRAFGDRDDLVIVSDQHVSIKNAVKAVYPTSFHGLCYYHIAKNLA
ncbi:Beta-glucosidase [Perilla frutescens var. hirtella]|uniref:Beta-glucosidase n=1 Tax=Perilla frutescens var. hirtella TaxID=608512 RepID=A0AAD4PD70_PERFH|nr:Beta-glucosidase [Perilla frutescens var. hirtella]